MRFTTDFFEYLRYSVAKEIAYDHDYDNGNGRFVVTSMKNKISGSSIRKEQVVD